MSGQTTQESGTEETPATGKTFKPTSSITVSLRPTSLEHGVSTERQVLSKKKQTESLRKESFR